MTTTDNHAMDDKEQELRKKAEAGDAQAQFQLYDHLRYRRVENERHLLGWNDPSAQRKEANRWLKKSAYQAWPEACDHVFSWENRDNEARKKLLNHLHQLGLQHNDTALRLWAVELLDDARMPPELVKYPEVSDVPASLKEALRALHRFSRQGDASASLNLAYIYLLGNSVPVNIGKCTRLIKLAAQQGDSRATWIMGWLSIYESADFSKAARYFLKSHKLGAFDGFLEDRPYHFIGSHFSNLTSAWAYACFEAGKPFPKELDSVLILAEEFEDGFYWSQYLLDAILEHRQSKKTLKFRAAIFEAESNWEFEGELNEDDELKEDFFQAGHLNLGRNINNYADYIVPFELQNTTRFPEFPRITETLRTIARQGCHEVQYILGLMGDTADDWLGMASDGGFALASYHLGFSRYAKEPEAALRHLQRVAYQSENNLGDFPDRLAIKLKEYDEDREIISEYFFKEIRDKALARIQEIKQEQAEHKAREQTQRDMLSYLTHTLNNTFAGRPEAARQAMRILGSEMYENNAGYTAINNIASMMSTFLFAQQLVSTFKLYIADPDALRKNWEIDREGDATVTTVLAMSLRQTLSQLVFSSNQLDALDRLLLNKGSDAIKNTRKAFMDEMIPLDVSTDNAQTVFDWIQNHIGIVQVTIDPAAELHFHSNSTRFTFFFSAFSELIFNALKYSDATKPINITWGKSGKNYIFRCENAWSEDSVSHRQGSDKGLVFINRLTQMLGASLETQTVRDRFIAELRFPEHLFKEAS